MFQLSSDNYKIIARLVFKIIMVNIIIIFKINIAQFYNFT